MLGLTLLWLDTKPFATYFFDQSAALIGGTIGCIGLVGYLYGVQSLYKVGTFSSTSVYSALLLVTLGLGILCARPARGQ